MTQNVRLGYLSDCFLIRRNLTENAGFFHRNFCALIYLLLRIIKYINTKLRNISNLRTKIPKMGTILICESDNNTWVCM